MTNELYMMAIEEIAELHNEIDRLEYNHEFLVSVHDTTRAEVLEREICGKLMEAKGMKTMLSFLSDVDYDTVSADVYDYRNN